MHTAKEFQSEPKFYRKKIEEERRLGIEKKKFQKYAEQEGF